MHPYITHPGECCVPSNVVSRNQEIPQMGDQSQSDVMSTDRSDLNIRENAK